MFVIARRDNAEVYYTGVRYIYQGEYYASIDNIDNAKKYKSLKRAENSLRVIRNMCAFGYEFYIKEIK